MQAVPHTNLAVSATRNDPPSVFAHGNTEHVFLKISPNQRFSLWLLSVPHSNPAVCIARRNPASVVAHHDAAGPALLSREKLRLALRVAAVPHRYCPVLGC